MTNTRKRTPPDVAHVPTTAIDKPHRGGAGEPPEEKTMHQSVALVAELESRARPADPFLELLEKWRALDAERTAAMAEWDRRTGGYPDCVEMTRPEVVIREAGGSFVILHPDNLAVNAGDAYGPDAAARVVELLRRELRRRERQRRSIRREVGAEDVAHRISAACDAIDAIEGRMLTVAATTWEGCVARVQWAVKQDLDPEENMRIINEAHCTMIDMHNVGKAG